MKTPWTRRAEDAEARAEEARRQLERVRQRWPVVRQVAVSLAAHQNTNGWTEAVDSIFGGHRA